MSSPESARGAIIDSNKVVEGRPEKIAAKVNLAQKGIKFGIEEITEEIDDHKITRAFITVTAPKKKNQESQVYRVQIAEKNPQDKWNLSEGVEDMLNIDLTGRRAKVTGPHVKKKTPLSTTLRPGKVGLWKEERDFHVDNLKVYRQPEDRNWRQGKGDIEQSTRGAVMKKGLIMQGRETAQNLQALISVWTERKKDASPQQLTARTHKVHDQLLEMHQIDQFKDVNLDELRRTHLPLPESQQLAPEAPITPDRYRELLGGYRDTLGEENEVTLDSSQFVELLRYGDPRYQFTPEQVDKEQRGGPRLRLRSTDIDKKLLVYAKKAPFKYPVPTTDGPKEIPVNNEAVTFGYGQAATQEVQTWFDERRDHLLEQLGIEQSQLRLTKEGQLKILSNERVLEEVQAAVDKINKKATLAQARSGGKTPYESHAAARKREKEEGGYQEGDPKGRPPWEREAGPPGQEAQQAASTEGKKKKKKKKRKKKVKKPIAPIPPPPPPIPTPAEYDITVHPTEYDRTRSSIEMPRPETTTQFGERQGNFEPVYIDQQVIGQMTKYLSSDISQEIGGGLLGDLYEDPKTKQRFTRITGFVPDIHGKGSGGRYTFTPDSWTHINNEADKKGKKIIGWVHSHPYDYPPSPTGGEWDEFIIKNYFAQPEQLTLILGRGGSQDRKYALWRFYDDEVKFQDNLGITGGDPQRIHQKYNYASVTEVRQWRGEKAIHKGDYEPPVPPSTEQPRPSPEQIPLLSHRERLLAAADPIVDRLEALHQTPWMEHQKEKMSLLSPGDAQKLLTAYPFTLLHRGGDVALEFQATRIEPSDEPNNPGFHVDGHIRYTEKAQEDKGIRKDIGFTWRAGQGGLEAVAIIGDPDNSPTYDEQQLIKDKFSDPQALYEYQKSVISRRRGHRQRRPS
jgi:proteasome lid subunit RPN8/RPN11